MPTWMKKTLAIILIYALPTTLIAHNYSPVGVYDVTYRQLDNGMGVILKQRGEAKNVAIRLLVNVGFDDFSCNQRETPHFLEHLLFTGTSQHGEYELERFIEDRGGSSNAVTGRHHTVYQVDIYNHYLSDAIDYLYEIITDSTLSPENIVKTRDIINQERGGSASTLRKRLYLNAIGKDAEDKGLEAMGLKCPNIVTPDEVKREDILEAYRRYYVPNNMVISVVGNFREPGALAKIEALFGKLHKNSIPTRQYKAKRKIAGPLQFNSTFSPIVDSDASVGIGFLLPGKRSDEIFVLRLLESYLHDRIYRRIRIDEGLAYAPFARTYELDEVSILDVSSDVEIRHMDQVLSIMEEEIALLANGKVNKETFEKVKKGLLLGYAQGFESNEDYADYYVGHAWELKKWGKFRDEESAIEIANINDVKAMAKLYLVDLNMLVYQTRPTLTYHQLFVSLAMLIIFITLSATIYIHRKRKQRQA